MAHMDSAELHSTWDLSPNEAYVGCGISGLISRLNVPNSIPFLRKLQCSILLMYHPTFFNLALKTLYRSVLPSLKVLTHTSTLPCPPCRLGLYYLLPRLPA